MKPSNPPRMLAKAADSATVSRSSSTEIGPRDHGELRDDSCPEEVLSKLRQLIEVGQLNAARQLTAEAAYRFPEHAEIQKARRFFARGEATPNPVTEPTTGDEIEWLKHPPESARGKWVALIGRQVVALANSAGELRESLRSKNLSQSPLIHHIAP